MTTSNKKNAKQVRFPTREVAIYIIFIAVALLIAVGLSGCRPQKEIIVKTEFRDRLQYDSVYVQKHDSIYIVKQGDTVRIEKFKTMFKDRLKVLRDTVVKTDTLNYITPPVTVEVPVKVQVYGFFWWLGLISCTGAILYLIFKFSNFQIFK